MGEVEEEKIDNMSYVFFQDVLAALGKKLNYESVSNILGRTVFDKKGGDVINRMVENANPLTKPSTSNSANTILGMAGNMTIIDARNNDKQKEQLQKALGDTSWFDEFIQ